jgi:hypothetical protein
MDCKTDKADLGKRNVTVRELTPRELDRWLSPTWSGPEYPRIIDELYAEKLLSGDVILLTTDHLARRVARYPAAQNGPRVPEDQGAQPFFRADAGTSGQPATDRRREIRAIMLNLMLAGYPEPWDWGWSMIEQAIEEASRDSDKA